MHYEFSLQGDNVEKWKEGGNQMKRELTASMIIHSHERKPAHDNLYITGIWKMAALMKHQNNSGQTVTGQQLCRTG